MQINKHAAAFGLPLLLLLAAVALWPGIHGPFLFDDEPNLKNLRELNGRLDRESIGVYLSLFPGVPGRPLSALSFIINDFSWPSEPLGFKLTNLWIHLLNGVLVFGLARTLFRAYAKGGAARGIHPDLVALGCAAIWLLNPIQVSAVFLTVQRMTELAATFLFAGLWGFAAMAPKARTSYRAGLAIAVLGVGTVLSFLSKENGALVPLLALVTCATLLRESICHLPLASRGVLLAGMALPSLAVIAMLVRITFDAPEGHFATRDFGLWERLMTESRVLLDYVRLIFAPQLSSSSLYNDDYSISRGLLTPISTLPAIISVLGALAVGLATLRRAPLVAFGLLWFLTGHLMESSVVALEIYFEHRNYLPLFGPALAIAVGLARSQGHWRRPAFIGFTTWLIFASTITHLQARAWGNETLLATYWYVEHPNSLRAQQEYADHLLQRGRTEEAHRIMASASARAISPANSSLQALTIECDEGRTARPGQLHQISETLAHSPITAGTAMILQRLRFSVQQGNCPQLVPPEIWLHFTEQVILNPNAAGVIRVLRVERAELFLAADRLDLAVKELGGAYGSGSNEDPRVAFYAAALLATAGRYDEALAWAERPLAMPWRFKNWMAQTDQQALALISTIEREKALYDATLRQKENGTEPCHGKCASSQAPSPLPR